MSRALALLATQLLSCWTTDSPSATEACRAAASADACDKCCTSNGTNASKHAKGGCRCILRYWVFLQ